MSDFTLILGSFAFRDFEIPAKIGPFSGEQKVSKSQLIGGLRVADAMGFDRSDVSWEGRFRGGEALDRALAIEAMAKAGAAVPLLWGGLSFSVIVTKFEPEWEKAYEIPYKITVMVVDDGGLNDVGSDSVDSLVGQDVYDLQQLPITTEAVLNGIQDLSDAVAAAGSLANAAVSVIEDLYAQSVSLAALVAQCLASAEAPAYAFGIAQPSDSLALAAAISGLPSGMAEGVNLLSAGAVVTRIGVNLLENTI
jgi:hypothetical protein